MNKMNKGLNLLRNSIRVDKYKGPINAYPFSQATPRKIIDKSKSSIKLMMSKVMLNINLQKIQQSKQASSRDLLRLISMKSQNIAFGDAMKIFNESESNIYWKDSAVTIFLQNVERALAYKESQYNIMKLDCNNNLEYFFDNIKFMENSIKKQFVEAILCFLNNYSENYAQITDKDYYKIKNFLLSYGCYSKHLLSRLQIFPFNRAQWVQKLQTLTDQEFIGQFETLSSIMQCLLKIGKLQESGKIKKTKLVTPQIKNNLIEVFFQYITFRPQNIQLLLTLHNPQNLFIKDIFESCKQKYFQIIRQVFNPLSLFYLKKNENILSIIFDLLYIYSSAEDKNQIHSLLHSYTKFSIISQNDSSNHYKYNLPLILLCQKFDYKSPKLLQQFLANEIFSNSNMRLRIPYWLPRKTYLRHKNSNFLKPIQILEILKLIPKENSVLRKEIENSLISSIQFTRVKADEESYNDQEGQINSFSLQKFYKYRQKILSSGEITLVQWGIQSAINYVSFGKTYFVYLRSLLELVVSLYGAKWTRGSQVLEKLLQQENIKIIEEYIAFPGLAETAFYLYYLVKYSEDQKINITHLEALVKKTTPSLNKACITQINNYEKNKQAKRIVPHEVYKFQFLSYPEKITEENFHKKRIQALFNFNWIIQNYAKNNVFRDKVSQELEKIASQQTSLENIVAIPLVFEFPFACDYSIIINNNKKYALFFLTKQQSKGESHISMMSNKQREKIHNKGSEGQSQKDRIKVRSLEEIRKELTIKYFQDQNYNIIFLTEDNVTQLKNYILERQN